MTKPEELARKIHGRVMISGADPYTIALREIETALQPLLDAGQELLNVAELVREDLGPKATWRIADTAEKLGEQLSQWRKK